MLNDDNKFNIDLLMAGIFISFVFSIMVANSRSLTVSPNSEEYQLIQNLRDELSNSPQNWNVIGFNIDENLNTVRCYKEKGLKHKNKDVSLCSLSHFLDHLVGNEIHIEINYKSFRVKTNMDKEISNTIKRIITEHEIKEMKHNTEKEKIGIRTNLSF